MEKLYGYKTSDVVALAEYLKGKENQSLTSVFEKFGEKYGKAKGTVRNLYYALAKKSREDQSFCKKYLGGQPIVVNKIVGFDGAEERSLIKEILSKKSQGFSVRKAIMTLADGDGKIALRYQNKFRNAIRNNPELIESVMAELNLSDQKDLVLVNHKTEKTIPTAHLERLKKEINDLVERIAYKTKEENAKLKEKISSLEKENMRLIQALFSQNTPNSIQNYFEEKDDAKLINQEFLKNC